MKGQHWVMIIVVFLVGYLAGVWQPSYGQGIVSGLKG